jgi:hypothetical protein
MKNALQVKVKSPKGASDLLSPFESIPDPLEDNVVTEWKPRVYAVPELKITDVNLEDCGAEDFELEDFKENNPTSPNSNVFKSFSTAKLSPTNRRNRQLQYLSP